jgi:hypothetical protein
VLRVALERSREGARDQRSSVVVNGVHVGDGSAHAHLVEASWIGPRLEQGASGVGVGDERRAGRRLEASSLHPPGRIGPEPDADEETPFVARLAPVCRAVERPCVAGFGEVFVHAAWHA